MNDSIQTNNTYFSRSEAESICRQYEHLINKRVDKTKDWLIDCIAVAPVDIGDQWIFAQSYMDMGCQYAALSFYKGHDFDVILISVYDPEMEMLTFKSIRTYCEEQELEFVIPEPTEKGELLNHVSRIISIDETHSLDHLPN